MNTGNMQGQQFTDPLPRRVKVITHLVSTLLPGFLFALITGLLVGKGDTSIASIFASILVILFGTLYYGGIVALYYWLAGGFEWKPDKLPLIRVVLFWWLGALLLSFILYALWYLIRRVISKRENVPMTSMMGRLLAIFGRTDYQEYLSSAIDDSSIENGDVCENCGTNTSLGSTYTFIHGKNAGTMTRTVSSTASVRTTTYTDVTESSRVYLCNKCVSLYGPRRTGDRFRKGLIISSALLVITILIDIIAKNTTVSVLPAMALIFGGPVAFFQYMSRKYKEGAPMAAYADLYNSPGTKFPHAESATNLENHGELLAIQVRKPSLIKTGVDSFFTHEEAIKLHPK